MKKKGDSGEESDSEEEEIPGIRKDAYQENFSSEIVHERDRLKELLDQTDFSQEENNKLRTENLERIAISSAPFSESNVQQEFYQSFSSHYTESEPYQTSIYQEREYEEYRHWSSRDQNIGLDSRSVSSNDSRSSIAYTPKPVENFEEQNKTGLALGAENESKEAREKYRLR